MTEQLGSLYAQMDRVKAKINAQFGFQSMGISLSLEDAIDGDTNDLSDYSASEFLWDGQVNVREIFNDMCAKADAIITATNFTPWTTNTTPNTASPWAWTTTGSSRPSRFTCSRPTSAR